MFSERVYRALLVVYPREFRREYGDLMTQFVRDRMRHDGRGIQGLLTWLHVLVDLATSALNEHLRGSWHGAQ